MNKKMLPHIIAVEAFVVFIVLGLACASTPSVPRDKQKKIEQLVESRKDLGLFTSPPLEGETVLGTYQDTLSKIGVATLNEQEAMAFVNNRVLPAYTRPDFYPHEAAARLMIKASAQFPDIDIEDLDVRSLVKVGDVRVQAAPPIPIPDAGKLLGLPPGPPKYSFTPTEYFTFKGVVIKKEKKSSEGDNAVIDDIELILEGGDNEK